MKKLDTLCDATAKKIVQHTLQSAMEGGPECPHTWFYQPRRPEKKPAADRTKAPNKYPQPEVVVGQPTQRTNQPGPPPTQQQSGRRF